MDEEIRVSIRQRWLNALFEFAHLDYQQGLWLGNYVNQVGNYSEAICQYFDDLDLDGGYKSFISDGIASQKEVAIVTEFHGAIRNYVDRQEKRSLSDENILRDIEWISLSETAKTNWNRLKALNSNNEDFKYMSDLENNFLQVV